MIEIGLYSHTSDEGRREWFWRLFDRDDGSTIEDSPVSYPSAEIAIGFARDAADQRHEG